MELEIFGDGWAMLEIIIRAAVMYVFTVFLIRIFGKRTTMTTAGFDLVLTVALGSIVASTVVSTTRPIAQGMAAIAAIAGLQYLLSKGVASSEKFQEVVVSPAKLLLQDGEVMRSNLHDERLSMEQLEQKVRQQGFASMNKLEAVVLESSGSVSVIGDTQGEGELIHEEEIGSRAI